MFTFVNRNLHSGTYLTAIIKMESKSILPRSFKFRCMRQLHPAGPKKEMAGKPAPVVYYSVRHEAKRGLFSLAKEGRPR